MPPLPRVYLDWNASAPLRPEARAAFLEALDLFGNPNSIHAEGRAARNRIDECRDEVASFFGCRPSEVVFTSGGTEANHLAVRSLCADARVKRFAVSRVEHSSVLRPLEGVAADGWETLWIPVSPDGRVEVAALTGGCGFACLQAANQETGALQPVRDFGEKCRSKGIPWHCDGVQAFGKTAVALAELGCATASLSGHKLGAPKGVGALFVRSDTPVEPLFRGGPQERGRRAGTENVAGIAALAAACRAAERDREADARWMSGLRDQITASARELDPLAVVNGPEDASQRLSNTVNLSFPAFEGSLLVQALDLEGVAVSAGSACSSGAAEPSAVLTAMGLPERRIRGALRVSLGPTTSPEDVEIFLGVLARVLKRLRPSGDP